MAQTTEEACLTALDRAKQVYNVGKIKEVEGILKDCLDKLPRKENTMEAYYLLCTTFLFLNDKEKATFYMLKLLKLDPEFAVESVMPIEFKQFHTSFKVTPIVTIGLKVGGNFSFVQPLSSYSISNLLSKKDFGSYGAKASYQLGLVGQIPLWKQIDFNVDVTYRSSTYEYTNLYLGYVNLTYTENQKYLEIPLLLKFNLKNKFDFTRDHRAFKNRLFPYASLGGTFSQLSGSTGTAVRLDKGAETTPLTLKSSPYDMKTARQTHKVFAAAAVGLEYKAGRSILAIEARYNRMFGNQVKPEMRYENQELVLKYGYTDNNFRIHNTAVTLSFAYPFYSARPKKNASSVKPRIIDVEQDK